VNKTDLEALYLFSRK